VRARPLDDLIAPLAARELSEITVAARSPLAHKLPSEAVTERYLIAQPFQIKVWEALSCASHRPCDDTIRERLKPSVTRARVRAVGKRPRGRNRLAVGPVPNRPCAKTGDFGGITGVCACR